MSVEALRRELEPVWANQPGLRGQLTAVNHSTIGLRYIVTSIGFLLVGGMLAMFMRLQLAWPELEVLDPERYNAFMTMHGTTMMFLFAVPLIEGLGLYLVPKMIGARDVPFPRMTAFGYWCYVFGGLLLYSSFMFDTVPTGGWFMYVPLTGAEFSPGRGADFWLLGVTFAEIAAMTASVELIVAILKTRAPGMAIQRMPLFAWYMLVTAFMIVFAFPPLILASILLEIERAFGFVFYEVSRGGDPLLWQHLFWLFGHPEVYILFLPAAGVVSTPVPVFARRPIVGYTWIVLAIVAMGFLSFGLWVHHMYAIGIPLLALSFFSAASMAVAIPTGVQIFAWIATLWMGRPQLRTPMRFVMGFFFIFVAGGLTGVMVALVPFDWQAHDSHFVVAHFHYVLIGGLLFPFFAAVYYWLPLICGRMPDDGLARIVFWLLFIGFNLTFLPMHLTGLLGMPRRVYTYTADIGDSVAWLNLLSTAAGFLLAVGFIAFVVSIALTLRHGRPAQPNPWNASSLEWALPVPPPPYNQVSSPSVAFSEPLWDAPDLAGELNRGEGFLAGAPRGARELIGTSVRAGVPEQVIRISASSWLPFSSAAALLVVTASILFKAWLLSVPAMIVFVALTLRWLWTTGDHDAPAAIDAGGSGAQRLSLPTQSLSGQAPGLWATGLAVLISSTLLVSLVFGYFYLWLGSAAWPPEDQRLPSLDWPILGLVALLASSVMLHFATRAGITGASRPAGVRLAWAAVLLLAFLVTQVAVIRDASPPQTHAYASLLVVIIGFHALHAVLALLAAGFMACASITSGDIQRSALPLRICRALWHYSTLAWLVLFPIVHLFPRVQ